MDGTDNAARRRLAQTMERAATAWISSLTDAHLAIALQSFPGTADRDRWFYTPTDHGGLTLAEMTDAQQARAFSLLASGLSEAGYVTASTIMSLENVLDRVEGHHPGFGHGRGRDFTRYYVRVFGDPSSGDWGWRFGGHHVSVNHTIVDGQHASGTPSFFGADPATSPLLGADPLRPLGGLIDGAHDLLGRFDPQQLGRAIVAAAPPVDTVGGNRPSLDLDGMPLEPLSLAEVWRDRFPEPTAGQLAAASHGAERQLGFTEAHRQALHLTSVPVGLPAIDMTGAQRDLLSSLLGQYIRRLPDAIAELELAKVSGENLNALHFAWAGSTRPGDPMYYRIQGDGLVVELDNTQRDANHIHAVWRDPHNDFGRDALADHYRTHDHHE